MLQWFGEVQILGDSLPRIRRFSPLGTWFVALPVWIATHGHGSGEPHRAEAVEGQAVPVLGMYFGRHPKASSW
jgi:hypothetical protein